MKKIGAVFSLLSHFVLLLVTVRPRLSTGPALKVFAKPTFRGGPETKFRQLEPILAKGRSPYSAIFCFSSVYVPLLLLRVLKLFGARILVNQNGVYYPAWFARGWKQKNAYMKRLNAIADHTFFQSRFALESYRRWVGEPPRDFSILYNPVATQVFFPGRRRLSDEVVRVLIFADISLFTKPLWEYLSGFWKELHQRPIEGPRVKWVIMGRVLDPPQARSIFFPPDVEKNFNLEEQEVAQVLRGCDLGLHLIYNDVCPNKVLECLASGVWVIGSTAGGTAELIGDTGEALPVEPGYDAPKYPSYISLRASIEGFIRQPASVREELRDRAARRGASFSLEAWRREVTDKAR